MVHSTAQSKDLMLSQGNPANQSPQTASMGAVNRSGTSASSFSQTLSKAILGRQNQPGSTNGRRQEMPHGRSLAELMAVRLGSQPIQSTQNNTATLHKGSAFGKRDLQSMERQLTDLMRAKAPSKVSNRQYDSREFDPMIQEASSRYKVPEKLIRAVIKAESSFNPRATSHAGAMGLMQLMPGTARDLGVQDAYNPKENIMGGTRYLRELLDRYNGNIPMAVAAYNWGMGNLERGGPLPAETRNYVQQVTRYYEG
jgi:soluble lytic murein transglycosylase-like protein